MKIVLPFHCLLLFLFSIAESCLLLFHLLGIQVLVFDFESNSSCSFHHSNLECKDFLVHKWDLNFQDLCLKFLDQLHELFALNCVITKKVYALITFPTKELSSSDIKNFSSLSLFLATSKIYSSYFSLFK